MSGSSAPSTSCPASANGHFGRQQVMVQILESLWPCVTLKWISSLLDSTLWALVQNETSKGMGSSYSWTVAVSLSLGFSHTYRLWFNFLLYSSKTEGTENPSYGEVTCACPVSGTSKMFLHLNHFYIIPKLGSALNSLLLLKMCSINSSNQE